MIGIKPTSVLEALRERNHPKIPKAHFQGSFKGSIIGISSATEHPIEERGRS